MCEKHLKQALCMSSVVSMGHDSRFERIVVSLGCFCKAVGGYCVMLLFNRFRGSRFANQCARLVNVI